MTSEHNGHRQRRIRLAIADDDPAVLEGIGSLLDSRFDIVARVGNGRELVEAVRKYSAEVVVADVSMPEMNGLQAARIITTECPGVKVVMLSVHDGTGYVDAAFDAGASGYVVKTGAPQELIPAIERVLTGGSYRPSATDGCG